ncbi:MAG: hypothetical protein AAGD25_28950 [Cyanobacteria bacterium P01_F01_bin.150]
MVAAFKNNLQVPQLPFQAWPQQSRQESPSPSFDYAEPTATPQAFIQPNPHNSSGLSPAANTSLRRIAPPQRLTQVGLAESRPYKTYGVSSSIQAMAQTAPIQQASFQPAAIQPTTPVSLVVSASLAQPVHSSSAISYLPQPASHAPWVNRLMVGQRSICLLTLALVGCALSLYGQSVYQHRQWGQSYSELERLQKFEQQGMAASEIMKQSLAEEAERPTSQMSSQMPDSSVSIEIAPVRPSKNDADAQTDSVLDLDLEGPMGY